MRVCSQQCAGSSGETDVGAERGETERGRGGYERLSLTCRSYHVWFPTRPFSLLGSFQTRKWLSSCFPPPFPHFPLQQSTCFQQRPPCNKDNQTHKLTASTRLPKPLDSVFFCKNGNRALSVFCLTGFPGWPMARGKVSLDVTLQLEM